MPIRATIQNAATGGGNALQPQCHNDSRAFRAEDERLW